MDVETELHRWQVTKLALLDDIESSPSAAEREHARDQLVLVVAHIERLRQCDWLQAVVK